MLLLQKVKTSPLRLGGSALDLSCRNAVQRDHEEKALFKYLIYFQGILPRASKDTKKGLLVVRQHARPSRATALSLLLQNSKPACAA